MVPEFRWRWWGEGLISKHPLVSRRWALRVRERQACKRQFLLGVMFWVRRWNCEGSRCRYTWALLWQRGGRMVLREHRGGPASPGVHELKRKVRSLQGKWRSRAQGDSTLCFCWVGLAWWEGWRECGELCQSLMLELYSANNSEPLRLLWSLIIPWPVCRRQGVFIFVWWEIIISIMPGLIVSRLWEKLYIYLKVNWPWGSWKQWKRARCWDDQGRFDLKWWSTCT